MIQQSQTTQPNSQSLLISGLFPSGEFFSDVVDADSSFEAMIRVISQARYSDAGGDLEVIRVADARTGAQLSDVLLSADLDLLREVDAVEYVLHTVQTSLDNGRTAWSDEKSHQLRAFVEFFDLVLSQAPGVFDGLCSGHSLTSDDEITIDFEDSRSLDTELVPADALYVLATAALEEGRVAAVYQVLTMARLTRVALSQACIRALV
ncbi:hypothetical protein [Pseudomonas psychrophila]|uniref:Uncharacterized protein n=1 Tax=Pseudomonas psychrophila TaxID=122355 RepID=A0A8I1FUF2_9PSED|nr:hypothetical protein [Pseudomonas psychrophila]AVX93233.1 hypothetical protein PkP19E3_34415 [Pseudomonas koreensis]MBJ2259219.1 hypothetical protein [Pseudomonas psychrophila]